MQHNVTNDHCMQSLLVILPGQTRSNVHASVSRTAVLLEMRPQKLTHSVLNRNIHICMLGNSLKYIYIYIYLRECLIACTCGVYIHGFGPMCNNKCMEAKSVILQSPDWHIPFHRTHPMLASFFVRSDALLCTIQHKLVLS